MPQNLLWGLWYGMTKYLSLPPTNFVGNIFRLTLSNSNETNSDIWRKIFKDETWINQAIKDFKVRPVLFGQNLYNLVSGSGKPVYLALVAIDKDGDLQCRKDQFLNSLQNHERKGNEIHFSSSNIILNVAEILLSPEITPIDTRRLFSYRYKILKSAYLLWDDPEHKVRSLGSEDIDGIGGQAFTLRSVSSICGLSITFPDNSREWYVFAQPGLKGVRLRNDRGWEWEAITGHRLCTPL